MTWPWKRMASDRLAPETSRAEAAANVKLVEDHKDSESVPRATESVPR
jgi:hypothetical protein